MQNCKIIREKEQVGLAAKNIFYEMSELDVILKSLKTMLAVRTENLTRTYTTGKVETHALEKVTIFLREGEFTSLVGPSEALLNLIVG